MRTLVVLLVVAGLGGGGFLVARSHFGGDAANGVRFRTAKVDRGEVVEGVEASGAVQPVLLVQVGTQISGVIDKLNADFNSKVKKGQVIATLDMRRLQAQVAQDDAAVARAKADVERVKALVAQAKTDVDRTKATLEQSKSDVQRVQALLTQAEKELKRQITLGEKRLAAASDVDAAVASRDSLAAQLVSANATVHQNEAAVASAEASVAQDESQGAVSEASVKQSEAQLVSDKVNLDYATIVSPVDGVVVSRSVDVGQTVAASLSAPTLFVIANDLTKIQVQTSVPEADVGKLHEGQKARFGVDAHPDQVFEGLVSQVRLNPTTVSNVVTYTVMVDADNPDRLLMPGMTANVTFEISRSAKETLRVPASALRLQVTPDLVEGGDTTHDDKSEKAARGDKTDKSNEKSDAKASDSKAEGGRGGDARVSRRGGRHGRALVYVVTPSNRLRAIPVRVGISSGVVAAVEPLDGATLDEGTEVVTAILRDAEPTTTNPFAPPRMTGPRGR